MLSLIVNPPPSTSLALLCLQKIVASFSKTDLEDMMPYIPVHLRRQLLHHTAIHAPLSNAKLYLLARPEEHIDGEFIVLGPTQTLPEGYFSGGQIVGGELAAWDEGDDWVPSQFHTLFLYSTSLTPSTFLSFPPTLTHLGLVSLPVALPLYRLPRICPTLVVLDLSYNGWIEETFDTVAWSKWKDLKVLGIRGCELESTSIDKVNDGRWDEVEIVR